MSSINVNNSECPACGNKAILSETCVICEGDGKSPTGDACRVCHGTGQTSTCAKCGSDYWQAKKREQTRLHARERWDGAQ